MKKGEDLPFLARDVEKLSFVAYPVCSSQVKDKIASAKIIIGIYNTMITEVLHSKGIVSLKLALAQRLGVKSIKERNKLFKNFPQNYKSFLMTKTGKKSKNN